MMLAHHLKLLKPRIALIIVTTLLIGSGAYIVVIFAKEFFWGQSFFHGTHYDFLAFFGAAHITLHGQAAQIYNPAAQIQFQRTIVPHAIGAEGYMPFLNPPAVAVLLSPLALLSVNDARVLWFVLNLALIALIAVYLMKRLQGKLARLLLILLVICSFPVYQNLIEGQLSIIILAGSLLALRFAERQRLFLSGVFLAALIIKPQLIIFVAVGLIIFRQWRVLAGMAASTAVFIAMTLPITGLSLYHTYAHFSSGVLASHFNGAGAVGPAAWEGTLKLAIGINGMYTSLFGQASTSLINSLTLVTIICLLVLYGMAVKQVKPGLKTVAQRLMFVASIALVLLIDPHAYAQDAILAFLMLPILLPLRLRISTVLIFLAFLELIIIDQHSSIHLVTLSLLALLITILVDAIKGSHTRRSIFHTLVISPSQNKP